jgi:hypothetical protein
MILMSIRVERKVRLLRHFQVNFKNSDTQDKKNERDIKKEKIYFYFCQKFLVISFISKIFLNCNKKYRFLNCKNFMDFIIIFLGHKVGLS